MPFEAHVALLCREMHWTFQEYCEQPDWLIDTIQVMLKVEGEYNASQNEKKVVNLTHE